MIAMKTHEMSEGLDDRTLVAEGYMTRSGVARLLGVSQIRC